MLPTKMFLSSQGSTIDYLFTYLQSSHRLRCLTPSVWFAVRETVEQY